MVATLICLVTSQVISYIKARAEASGLRGDGGFIERPERLIIVLVGAGLSDLPLFPVPWLLPVAMWLLAAASMVTCAQRLHTVRHSSGAATRCRRRKRQDRPSRDRPGRSETAWYRHLSVGSRLADWGYAAGWLTVRAMPEFAARNVFDAGALYASRNGGPEQLRKNLARVIGVAPPTTCPAA